MQLKCLEIEILTLKQLYYKSIVSTLASTGSCVVPALMESRHCVGVVDDPVLFIHGKVRTVEYTNKKHTSNPAENIQETEEHLPDEETTAERIDEITNSDMNTS